MKKKKNTKGFTLVEIIVVLLIIGILLAITIPSIMGYVGKAKDAQLEAEARSGYVAAQTIVARKAASGVEDDDIVITAADVADELGEAKNTNATIQSAGCTVTDGKVIKCAFLTKSSATKYVLFDTTNKEEPTTTSEEAPSDIDMTPITVTP